jgi:hypothetical protein
VDERDCCGTFADRATYTLHRSRARVTNGVHAWHARLERHGRAPVRSLDGRPGDNEAMRIEQDATATQPFGFRVSTSEYA